ncbi:Non-specific lipid transfer protein GPI-anchored 3 [Linum grandiflorum]
MATRTYEFILFLPLLLFYSSIRNVDCQSLDDLVKTYGDALTNSSDSPSADGLRSGLALISNPGKAKCLQKLAPCKEFIHYEGKPPATCCDPLVEMVTNGTEECVCIFNSEDLLHSVNLTKAEAVSMATMCGSKPDLSSCPDESSNDLSFFSLVFVRFATKRLVIAMENVVT